MELIMASLFDVFPAEIVNEIMTQVINDWPCNRARWAQMCLLSAVCSRFRAVRTRTGIQNSVATINKIYDTSGVMHTLLRKSECKDLWRAMFRCGAKIDPVNTLEYALTEDLDDIRDAVADEYELSYFGLDDLLPVGRRKPDGMIAIWRSQALDDTYFKDRFWVFKNPILYRYIATVLPTAPATALDMIDRDIPAAILAYYPDHDLGALLFEYAESWKFNLETLIKFIKECNVVIDCVDLARLVRLIPPDTYSIHSSDDSNHIRTLTTVIDKLTKYIVCDGCSDKICSNHFVINRYELKATHPESINPIKSRFYTRSALNIHDTILTQAQLMSCVIATDDMFTLRYAYVNNIFSVDYINYHTKEFIKTRHCLRWLIAKGILENIK